MSLDMFVKVHLLRAEGQEAIDNHQLSNTY